MIQKYLNSTPPSSLLPLAVAGELARGVRTDCTAIIIMEFPCNASVDDVLGRACRVVAGNVRDAPLPAVGRGVDVPV